VDGMPRENAVAETRGEALDLRLDARGHVFGAAVRHVTIRPRGVLAGRSARRIEQRLLGDEYERTLGRTTLHHFGFGMQDIVESPADMNRGGAATFGVVPRDRLAQGPIHFEHAGAGAKTFERGAIAGGQRIAGDPRDLSWAQVEKNG